MCQAVYQKFFSQQMWQAVYKMFFSQEIWQAVYQKYFLLNRCDKLCIKKKFLTDVTSCVSKKNSLQMWQAVYQKGRRSAFLVGLEGGCSKGIVCRIIFVFYLFFVFLYHLLLSIMIKTVINHQNQLWSSRSWLSVTVGLISTGASESQSKTDIGNQLPNLGSSSSLRILRILMILGTNFPTLDPPPHWWYWR